MTIAADAGFRAQWPDVLERIQGELSARPDLDACARVELQVQSDDVITVSVTLPDGRAASRSVSKREDILPLLQALLLVPELPPAPAAASPSARAAPRPEFSADTRRAERDEPPSGTAGPELGVELALLTGARMGDGQLGLGAGALSFLELSGWLLGFEGRVDSYRALGGGHPHTVLELGLLAGRRLDLGSVALDLAAGPAVATDGFASSHAELRRVDTAGLEMPLPPPLQESETGSGPVPRLLLGARLSFRPRSVFRTFVGVDGELGLAQASPDPSSADLPQFCVGFSLGARVGTP
jgi:hypothetical protein